MKMAVKLLLVFVEYNESNTLLLLQAIDRVDSQQGATYLQFTCITLHALCVSTLETLTSLRDGVGFCLSLFRYFISMESHC